VRFIVLTGLPGVGKTAMLERLAAAGEQVIDLEALAGHRGSSFGRVGLTSTEPTKREFDALVSRALAACDPARPVWLEDEGPHIGRLWLPDEIVSRIVTSQTVELSCPRDVRVARLCATYGTADPDELIAATQKIRRRLGNSRTDRVISHFHAGRPEAAIRVLLEYFDEGYALRAAGDTRRPLPADEMPAVLREGR
jgi:tRNA 2-selenouridine synthase